MRNLLFRPILFISLILGFFIVGELLVIGGLTWRNHERLQKLQQDIASQHQLEDSIIVLISRQFGNSDLNAASLKNNQFQQSANTVTDQEISADIEQLQGAFTKARQGDNNSLQQALIASRNLFDRHNSEEELLLKKIAEDSKLEFELALSVPFVLLGGILLIGRFFFKRHLIEPLGSLKSLLQQLADGNRKPIEQRAYDPTVQSLFDNYNQLVSRLTELEQEQLNYTRKLESQIRKTSSQLLEKSQQIARSERLSVIAELSASTAHELRNPLAGIRMALDNIILDNPDTEFSERLQHVNREIKRLTEHLNDLLALTRNTNKPPKPLNILAVCQEISDFIKYQMPENVTLRINVQEQLATSVPETEFRLAMINLLLNSIQAIDNQSGEVTISAQQEQDTVTITVEDSGLGFSETLLKQGIQPFVSFKSTGTGLGLAMVQRFVKSQMGAIQLMNTPAGHARVIMTLPISV